MDTLAFRIQRESLVRRMRQEAGRLGCRPAQIGIAILDVVFTQGLVDSVLDGDDPKVIAPLYGQMVSPRTTLGSRQTMILTWMVANCDADGRVEVSYSALSRHTQCSEGSVGYSIKALTKRGDIAVVRTGTRQQATLWQVHADHLVEVVS